MKLINSKNYRINDVKRDGQCSMCAKNLEFQDALYEAEIIAFADCCGWTYLLKPFSGSSDLAAIAVIPNPLGVANE